MIYELKTWHLGYDLVVSVYPYGDQPIHRTMSEHEANIVDSFDDASERHKQAPEEGIRDASFTDETFTCCTATAKTLAALLPRQLLLLQGQENFQPDADTKVMVAVETKTWS